MGLLLVMIGFLVGTFGTLIGAGGGFILMPVLLMMYPQEPPETLTAISLAVVFFNAFSGSVAYAYHGKVHWRSVLAFSLAATPGTLLGVYATRYFPREKFELVFGIFMAVMSIYLMFPKRKPSPDRVENILDKYRVDRFLDRDGHEHVISYNMPLGIAISIGVGFISSLLGIGGGIIHVPALVQLLHFPVHVATATSHAILAVMSALGTAEHIYNGEPAEAYQRVLYLAPGAVVGAQLGARLSKRVKDVWIIRALALALLSVGIRFIFF